MIVTLWISLSGWEGLGLLALLTTTTGLWLNWQRNAHLSGIEEDVKNAKLTSDQAWDRSRSVNRWASAVLIVGVGLMLVTAIGLFA